MTGLALDRHGIEHWMETLPASVRTEARRQSSLEPWPADRDADQDDKAETAQLLRDLAALLDSERTSREHLVSLFGDAGGAAAGQAGDTEALRQLRLIMAYLSPPRRLRLFLWLAEEGLAGGGIDILRKGDVVDTLAACAIEASLLQYHRRDLLKQVFDPRRLDRIATALETRAHEMALAQVDTQDDSD